VQRAGVRAQAQTVLSSEKAAGVAEPDAEVIDHALERLEATLRARTAIGFNS
jgi:hypothetical protein